MNAADWGCPYCGGDLTSRPIEPDVWICTACGVELLLVNLAELVRRIEREGSAGPRGTIRL